MSAPIWPADHLERWPIDRLVPFARNARTHSDANIAAIAASIREWGWTTPVLAQPDGTIIAGHGRVLAARQLGIAEIPVIVAHGWSEAQIRAYVLADNKLPELAGWDMDLLKVELGELRDADFDLSLIGFSEDELAGLLVEETEGLTDPDDVPEVPEEPVTVAGDVWVMGRHRLACGDSTSGSDLEKLMVSDKANYVFTSPPYGINLEYERDKALGELVTLIEGVIKSIDSLVTKDAYATINYADVLVPGDDGFTDMTQHYTGPFKSLGWVLRGNRIWHKPFARLSLAYGTSTTMNLREWEYVRTWRKGRGKEKLRQHGMTLRGVWASFGDSAIVPDWRSLDDTTTKGTHPAAFPVLLPVAGIRCYTDENAIVFEPFCGSGTTLIACEIEGRQCRGMEIDPAYCDVICKRFMAFAGKDAVLESTGQTFAQVAEQRLGPMPERIERATVTA